jgi:hypothetical protein
MKRAVKTDQRWRHILRVIDETFEDYLNGLVALRHGVVADLKRKLADDRFPRPDPEPRSSPGSRGSSARHPRVKGRRRRG